ncbi:MAG: SGNH family hydrolase, partial [Xanthobacteraceae bacterium]
MAISKRRRLAIALSIVTAGLALAVPAGAQMFGTHAAFDQRPRAEQVQWRELFPFPFFGGRRSFNPDNPFGPPRPQTFESTRPPPPRKVETPPTETVLVIGDSLADWLGYGLEETFADTPDIGIVRKIKPYAGLVRYEARNDAPDWSQAVKEVLAAEKPSAIVVMLGINDRLPLRDRAPPAKGAAAPAQGQSTTAQGQGATAPAASPADTARPDGEQPAVAANEPQRRPGSYHEFHTDKWAELYDKRIDDMIAALKSKGVPVLWVGLPAIRGTRSTSDMSYLDELYRARAEKAGIPYVDIWDGFVDESGRYAVQGPDFEGQIRRLRTGDGVHFTKAGAVKLAHYVEHDLRRVLSSHIVPVALPGPEELAPKGSVVGARPAIGPVVPLAAIGGGEGGDLLGAPSHPAPAASDPLATRVLSRG